ncbi:MAG: 4'-phosphopantetheinyl transferase superfamily protein [Verrucomicrobiota bacterium]
MELLTDTWRFPLEIVREAERQRAVLVLSAASWHALEGARAGFLHAEEAAKLASAGVPKRQADYLRGRYCAKVAVAALAGDAGGADGAGADGRAWQVAAGVFGQPVVRGAGLGNVQVSIAHSGDWAAALACDEGHPMAVDIELHDVAHGATIRGEVADAELAAFARAGWEAEMSLTFLWAAKEALGKVLRSGLMAPLSFYEVGEVERTAFGAVCTYRHFAQYKSCCAKIGKLVVAIALPRKSALQFDWGALTSVRVESGPTSAA